MARLTREEAIAIFEAERSELDTLFARLSDAEMTLRATIGGGDWSAKDLMGHIAFWEELAAQALADWRSRRRPGVEEIFDAGRPGTDAANARNQEHTASQPLKEVSQRADAAHRAIIEAIQGLTDDEWQAEPPYPDAHEATLGELLGAVLWGPAGPFRHASAHLDDLRSYVESLPPPRTSVTSPQRY